MTPAPCALVTGAAMGIGAGVALRLAADGWSVAATAEVHPTATVDAALSAGGSARGRVADLREEGAAADLVAWAVASFGRLDALVCCAGVTASSPVEAVDLAHFDALASVNLRAPWQLAGHAAPHLAASGRGSVVNVSSLHARTSLPEHSVYAASKGGLDALTRALAIELGPRGVRVNAVAPGLVETERWRADPGYDSRQLAAQVPLGRVGRPEDVASVVSFLLSEGAGYVSGAVLEVDGGLSSRLAARW